MKERMIVLMVIFVTGFLTSQASSDLKNFAKANNDFSINIYKSLPSTENIFFCPASIYTALGMLYEGARGDTATEMWEALSYPVGGFIKETIHPKFKEFIELLEKNYIMEIANVLAMSDEFVISAEYVDLLQFYYKAIIKIVDFRTEKQAALDEINGWVSDETQGAIPKLLEDVDEDTVLVLLSAAYFKGFWESEFNASHTKDDVFYVNGTVPKTVPMMNGENSFFYSEFDENHFKALKLPYEGEQLSMVVLLPNEKNGLKELEDSLTVTKLTTILSSLNDSKQKVVVSIPKFKFEDHRKLVENLKHLGMNDAFNSIAADFTGISSSPGLYVTDVVHKAVIEVNEKGSKLTGGSSVVDGLGSTLKHEFKADHPFLFLIYHQSTEIVLFMGRVTDP